MRPRGTADFTPVTSEAGCTVLRYQETGALTLPSGQSCAVRQSYVWRLSEDRRHVEVCFDEEPPRVMHRLALTAPSQQCSRSFTPVKASVCALVMALVRSLEEVPPPPVVDTFPVDDVHLTPPLVADAFALSTTRG